MKVSRLFVLSIVLFAMVLVFSMKAQAELNLIGTATYNSSDYNLIYDDDLGITWLDYSNAPNTWAKQMIWASGLNGADVLTYNFNPGISMNWSDEWRLPTTVDGPYVYGYDGTTTGGFNITSSEMGHLFYTELGNEGNYDKFGYPTNYGRGCSPDCLTSTGDFQNLDQSPLYNKYWSGTEYSATEGRMWVFNYSWGNQYDYSKYGYYFAMSVRPGTIVPEPISSILLDIKPQSCPNPVNMDSQGVLPVAILGTEDFDVSTIDLASIQLAGVAPIRSNVEDVSTPVIDKQDECDCTTEGEDGFDDLTLKFDTQEIVDALGEVADGDELVLTITGELLDGTSIEGEDCIVVLSK